MSISEVLSQPAKPESRQSGSAPVLSSALSLEQLYESDETAWLEEMAGKILAKQHDQLDFQNLKAYLQDMAIRDRRETISHLRQLLIHLLKWQFQPSHRSKSWSATINNQRDELEQLLSSKTLRNHAEAQLVATYRKARKRAAEQTDVDLTVFPETCPYTLDFILGEDFPA